MRFLFIPLTVLLGVLLNGHSAQAADPSLYEYYHSGGIKSGLEANSDQFTLNGKHFVIYSGSFHYFRVVPENWRPILQRFKAAGLNSVQLYLSWNLHEDIPDHFDFESAALNLEKFLEEIKAADMFAIVRPGPYICAEWEMGGYPSWLLRDPNMQLRTMYKPHLDRVKPYMEKALSIINKHQFTDGGPVIMLQLENEYGWAMSHTYGPQYLNFLRDIVDHSGFKQMLFTSDPGSNAQKYPINHVFSDGKVLETANLNSNALKILVEMKKHQPNKPSFVTEFWPGWFDAWHEQHHHVYTVDRYDKEVSDILFHANGSVNFYMFIGGTNFGFTNGARIVTSYDYDAPLSEAGNYTAKYHKTRELYQKLVAAGKFPKIHLPDVPPAPKAHVYGKVPVVDTLAFNEVLQHAQQSALHHPVPMELLNFAKTGTQYGQRFGFINYRVNVQEVKSSYEVTGHIRDHAVLLVDHKPVSTINDGANSLLYNLSHPLEHKASGSYSLDLLVENLGRPNGGDAMNHARKGILDGEIKVDGKVIDNIFAYSLDFNQSFVAKIGALKEWTKFDEAHQVTPALFRAHLNIEGPPQDTYLSLPGWSKGSVFVNNFNIGRYWSVGPVKTLYIPGPVLKTGANLIVLFELHKAGHELVFQDHPVLQ